MVHELKIYPNYFRDVETGRKTFEVRKNDRPYREGDYVALNEYENGKYTGRFILAQIVYMLADEHYVKKGYCILGIAPRNIELEMVKVHTCYDREDCINDF